VLASKEGNEAVFIAPLRHDPEAAFKRRVVLGSKEALPIQRAVQRETGSGFSVDYRNKKILAVWRYLPRLKWGMVIKMDTDEAYHHIYNIRRWTLFIGIATIITVILIAFRISRSISKPIKALHKGSEIIGSGNLDYKVDTDAQDEIGELSRSFNEMTLKLKNSLTTLEDEINERKEAEAALRESEDRYRAVVEDQTEIICRFYPDGTYIFVNDVYCRFFGKSKEELIGRKWFPDAHPEDLEMIQEKLSTMTPHNPVVVIENRVFSGDKVLRWMQFVNRGFYDQDGNLLEIQSVGRDITEHKKTEMALKLSEEKYRNIVETSTEGIWIIDSQGNTSFVNNQMAELLGYAVDEMINRNLFEFMDEEGKKEARRNLERRRKGITEMHDFRFKKKDGSDLWTIVSTNPIMNDNGEFMGALGMITDITERKKAEIELQKEKEKLQKYLDISAVIVVMIDADQTVTLINKKGCEILEYKEEEIIGKNWFDNFLPYRLRDKVKRYHSMMMMGDITPVEYFENEVLNKSGQERLIAWYNTAFRDEEGNIIQTLGSGVDITERKKDEEQIKKSLKEKEVLLKEVHHRVKNNMAVISSLLKLQADRVKDEHYREMFSDSMGRIKTMAIIHEKLYKSKDLAKVDFNDYLKDIINSILMSYGFSSHKVALKTDVKDVAFGVDTAIPCGLIINELVSNSLKHAFPGDGDGAIKVSLRRNDKAEVELTVSDNGVGIPENVDFRKTDSLGLNLVNALVGQLNGKIELHRDQGTEFQITFGRRE
jgi:PAS domain S-box-containing protein